MNPPAIERLQIGRYTNLTLLGQGGMGAVYRAHDPLLERTVALKVVLEQNPQFVARFEREAKAVARLSHPNIVQVYDFGQDSDGNPFFVMELVKGKSLEAIVKERGPFPPDKVIELLRQAALGLSAAHAAGIVHRDVKPQNILLDEAGQLKLVDFGIARVTGINEGLTSTNEALGTLHYMAPEVLSGQPADSRADIYSLGLVAFHLLTGRPPFAADSAVGVAMKQLNEALPDLEKEAPKTPAALRRLIARMTEKPRERRIQKSDEIARAAVEIADEMSRTEPMPVKLPLGSRRVILISAGLGLCSTVLLAALAGSLKLKRRHAQKLPEPPIPVPPPPPPTTIQNPPIPAPPPTAAQPPKKLTGPVRVAILRFRNLTGDPSRDKYGEGIAEAVTLAFDGLSGPNGKIKLLERNQFEDGVLKTSQESLANFTDKAEVVAYGRMIGAEIIVQGAFQRLDEQLRITARFTKVETSEIISTVGMTEPLPAGKSGKQEFALYDRVAAKLREDLLKLVPSFRN